jgi:hypothetical protein
LKPAEDGIQFGLVHYDSPGSDTGRNTSVNAEYFTIKNTGGQPACRCHPAGVSVGPRDINPDINEPGQWQIARGTAGTAEAAQRNYPSTVTLGRQRMSEPGWRR